MLYTKFNKEGKMIKCEASQLEDIMKAGYEFDERPEKEVKAPAKRGRKKAEPKVDPKKEVAVEPKKEEPVKAKPDIVL